MANEEIVFKGMRFEVHALEQTGKGNKVFRREYVVHPGAVVILPILDAEHIVMIRNYRFAVRKELWELPAGTLEPQEPPLETAKRELIEETGYKAEKMTLLTTFFPSPGFCNEIMYSYVAEGLSLVGQDLDETEQIEVEIVKLKDAIQMVRKGTICDAKSLTTLLYYHSFIKHA
jgi:ADP-ribose pyrophosphatase